MRHFCLYRRFAASALLAFAPALLHGAPNTLESRRAQLRGALHDEWEYQLRTYPELATAIGDSRYNDRLSDYSPASFDRALDHANRELRIFEAIDTTDLSAQEQLNKTLMVRSLREQIDGARFKDWEMPVNQMNGVHLDYAALASQTTFHSTKDYEDYLGRLHQLPRVFDQVTEDMQLGMRDKLMPPRYLLERVATEAQDIAGKPLDQSPFTAPARSFAASVSSFDQERLRTAILKAVHDEVDPAYAKFAAFVRTTYAPAGRTDYGIWALPEGAARYRYAIHEHTTTDLSAEQIHQMGLAQVTEIEEEMLKLAQQQGFHDLASFNAHIRQDPHLYGTSGQQIFDLYKHYADQMSAKLPQLFGHLPKTRLDVVPMEAFRAPDAVPADYSPGSGNGSRPGRINVNEYDPQHRLLLNVEAIAYHEGIPGHHMQFSVAQELPDVPPFRRFASYNAYSEGWAFYAERLGKDVGFYQDPYSEYGRLENEMWRSVRLVVDTGVHAQHWSRQQMIDFFHQHTAMDDQNIQTEVDRYIAWPAQALSYKLGQMKILELRERARRQLGSRFDIRAFHDAILANGPLPLDTLDSLMNQWIAAQAAAPVH